MSHSIHCTCGRKKNDHSDLVVVQYKCNYVPAPVAWAHGELKPRMLMI